MTVSKKRKHAKKKFFLFHLSGHIVQNSAPCCSGGCIWASLGDLFVINNLDKNIPMIETYKGALPFVASDVVRIVILVAFPGITLFLVRLLF